MDQPWWNLADKQAENATGQATTVTVKAGPASVTALANGTPAYSPIRPAVWATIAAAIIVAILLLAIFWRRARAHVASRRATRALSEPVAFDALTRACHPTGRGRPRPPRSRLSFFPPIPASSRHDHGPWRMNCCPGCAAFGTIA